MEERLPTILIDIAAGEGGEFDRKFFERLGHEVLVCHGPHEGRLCPILANAGCELVEQAHGIVFALDLDRPQHRAILERYRTITAAETPIRVVVQPGQYERYHELLSQFELWVHEPTVADLDGFAAEVETAERLR